MMSLKNAFSFSTVFPKLVLMFDCGSLQLFPSVAGLSLSDDYWSHQRLQNSIRNHFIGFFFSPSPLTFGSILVLWAIQPLGPGVPDSVLIGHTILT